MIIFHDIGKSICKVSYLLALTLWIAWYEGQCLLFHRMSVCFDPRFILVLVVKQKQFFQIRFYHLVKIWLLSTPNISPWSCHNSKSLSYLHHFLESSFVFLFISLFETWIIESIGQHHTKQVKKAINRIPFAAYYKIILP